MLEKLSIEAIYKLLAEEKKEHRVLHSYFLFYELNFSASLRFY